MKFRTEINIVPKHHSISHESNILLVGSCFAESIGEKLSYFKLPVKINPCGILFNPISIKNAFQLICKKTTITENELVFHDGMWHSFYHHGSYSNADRQSCTDTINKSIAEAYEWIKNTKTIIITLGTSYVWEYKTGLIVSNCHKIPSTDFKHYMLSVEEVQYALQSIIDSINEINSGANVIFTVSPIRYLNHGAHHSQLSKATLLLAIDLIQQKNNAIDYFPSYEIMMDDLRDYRFYADDMIHPSSQAIEYIWEKFTGCYFNSETIALNTKIDAFQKAVSHRMVNPDNESGKKFITYINNLRNNLQKEYPTLPF